MIFTESRRLPVVRLAGPNLFLPFAWGSKPANPSAGGAGTLEHMADVLLAD